jgi:hypothetical protein
MNKALIIALSAGAALVLSGLSIAGPVEEPITQTSSNPSQSSAVSSQTQHPVGQKSKKHSKSKSKKMKSSKHHHHHHHSTKKQ